MRVCVEAASEALTQRLPVATGASTQRADHPGVHSQAGPAAVTPVTSIKHQSFRLTADTVLGELRRNHFAVLSTVGPDGAPHSAGVNYGLSTHSGEIALYVMTRAHLQKARDIQNDPRVALVVPIGHRFAQFLPPATIQLRGRAEIIDGADDLGIGVFRGFWIGRRILRAYEKWRRQGETRICFLKITPDPDVRTYMVGSNLLDLSRNMEAGAGRVVIPTGHKQMGPA